MVTTGVTRARIVRRHTPHISNVIRVYRVCFSCVIQRRDNTDDVQNVCQVFLKTVIFLMISLPTVIECNIEYTYYDTIKYTKHVNYYILAM